MTRGKSDCVEKQWHCLLPHQLLFILSWRFIYPKEKRTTSPQEPEQREDNTSKLQCPQSTTNASIVILSELLSNCGELSRAPEVSSAKSGEPRTSGGPYRLLTQPEPLNFFFFFFCNSSISNRHFLRLIRYCRHGFSGAAEVCGPT